MHVHLSRRSGAVVAAVAAAAAGALAATSGGTAAATPGTGLTGVQARSKAPGVVQPDVLSPELAAHVVAQGATAAENPHEWATHYGYNLDDGLPMVPAPGTTAEARKTEPDKNTYLVLRDQKGADPAYDYGTHFLYQGHEGGKGGYVSRINLDADAEHRLTVLATRDVDGKPLPTFDGSTWDPFSRTLLLTAEAGNKGGVWSVSPTYGDPRATDVSGALGRGGYEGAQVDSAGQVWLVEDVGGAKAGANGKGKQPNSFVYRYVPATRGDLQHGRLEALQVVGAPSPLDAADPFETAVHTPGRTFATRWVTIHDTATDGTAPFDANAAAKAKQATPFKRPENGVFRPGTRFGEFYFTETGDTNADSPFNGAQGGWGGVFRLAQSRPTDTTGTLSLALGGDKEHTGFDNIAFWDDDHVAVVEDGGDTLHTQRKALDSGYLVDVRKVRPEPLRFLAEGRDASATLDSAMLDAGTPGYANDGDNEITGIHVSDGDPSAAGLLGARSAHALTGGWRVFFTRQHGDNVTYEVTAPARQVREHGEG